MAPKPHIVSSITAIINSGRSYKEVSVSIQLKINRETLPNQYPQVPLTFQK